VRLIRRLSSSRPRPLAVVPALLRLVVGPCLNAHKRHVRDPLYSFNSLLERCCGLNEWIQIRLLLIRRIPVFR
jgi:hypothetical protein